jgi:hypothetical protein
MVGAGRAGTGRRARKDAATSAALALSLTLLLALSPGAAANFHHGDFVQMARKSQHGGVSPGRVLSGAGGGDRSAAAAVLVTEDGPSAAHACRAAAMRARGD